MSITIYGRADLKAQAKFLRKLQPELSHSAALETVSRWLGFKDWNTASAKLPETVPLTYPVARALLDDMKATLVKCGGRGTASVVHADFHPWYVKADTFFVRMCENDFKIAMVTVRFAVSREYGLPFHMNNTPGFEEFTTRIHKMLPDLDMSIVDQWLDEFDPSYRLARLADDTWKSGELNSAVQRIARENPIWNADEVVEYFKATHRPFNENTVRGLWKRFRGEPAKLISTTQA